MRVKATGGGSYKFAALFRERLGLIIEGEDEMACMVEGCNFLLNAGRPRACRGLLGRCRCRAHASIAIPACHPACLPACLPLTLRPSSPHRAVRHEAFQYENGTMKFVDLPSAGGRGWLGWGVVAGWTLVLPDALLCGVPLPAPAA